MFIFISFFKNYEMNALSSFFWLRFNGPYSREIRLLQMMVHENIVRLLDLYTPDTSLSTLSIV